MISGVNRLIKSLTYSDLAVLVIQESHVTGEIIALCSIVGKRGAYAVMQGNATGSHSVCFNVSLTQARISFRLLADEMLSRTRLK